MAQRDILQNTINTLNTLKGPAKILWASEAIPFPTMINQVIDPTTGAPGASWVPFGLTRGGINVTKNQEVTNRDDVDQIQGAYDSDITSLGWSVSTQLAEVLDSQANAIAFDMGSATIVLATSAQATQVMVPLDQDTYKPVKRKIAVVFPKSSAGKLVAYVFRQAQVAGGEKTMRFAKDDPASPALEFTAFPEIATTIPVGQQYGAKFEMT